MHGDMHGNIHTYIHVYIHTYMLSAYGYTCTHTCRLTYIHAKRKTSMLLNRKKDIEIISLNYRDYMPLKYTPV